MEYRNFWIGERFATKALAPASKADFYTVFSPADIIIMGKWLLYVF